MVIRSHETRVFVDFVRRWGLLLWCSWCFAAQRGMVDLLGGLLCYGWQGGGGWLWLCYL